MINRRQFLLGTAAAAAGVAGAAVLTTVDPFHDTPPAAAADGERFTHRGRLVVILPLGAMMHAMVNGNRDVHIEPFGGQFLTHLLPFDTFKRPRQLMEAVIDAEDDGLLII
jgi:hypothetical protein